MLKNWRQKLGALVVATVIWYLIKGHLRRRGSQFDYVPGQVQVETRQVLGDSPFFVL